MLNNCVYLEIYNLFSKTLMSSAKFNVHETCIPSPLPKLTGFTFVKTLHEPYSSAFTK